MNLSILRLQLPMKKAAKITSEQWNDLADRIESTNEVDALPHQDLTSLLDTFVPFCCKHMDLGESWQDAKIIDVRFQPDVDIYHMAFVLQLDELKIPTGKIDGNKVDQKAVHFLEKEIIAYLMGTKRMYDQMDLPLGVPVKDAQVVEVDSSTSKMAEEIVTSTLSKARSRNKQKATDCNDNVCPVAS